MCWKILADWTNECFWSIKLPTKPSHSPSIESYPLLLFLEAPSTSLPIFSTRTLGGESGKWNWTILYRQCPPNWQYSSTNCTDPDSQTNAFFIPLPNILFHLFLYHPLVLIPPPSLSLFILLASFWLTFEGQYLNESPVNIFSFDTNPNKADSRRTRLSAI